MDIPTLARLSSTSAQQKLRKLVFAVCSKNFTQGNITEFNKHWISGHDKKDPFQFKIVPHHGNINVVYDLIKYIPVITNLSIQYRQKLVLERCQGSVHILMFFMSFSVFFHKQNAKYE